MIYRDFQDVKLSALGMGAMRLPVVDGDDSKIDEAAAFAMVDEAMARASTTTTPPGATTTATPSW